MAKTRVSKDRRKEINNYIKNNYKEMTKEKKEKLFEVTGTLSNKIRTPVKKESFLKQEDLFVKTQAAKRLPGSKNWMNYLVRYTTFIPYKSVEDPKPFNSTYLKGDNRGFGFFARSFRTRSDIYTYFSPSKKFKYDKKIGQSERCKDKDCKNVIEKKTASDSGIEVFKDKVSNKEIKWRVKHDVGIPFGDEYPNINYFYEATLTNKPSLVVKGAHDKAPNHEFYIALQNSDAPVQTIHKYKVSSKSDFLFLIPGAPQEFFNVSL
ncbi:DUF3238 domain-containing protein [Salinithrix halophila]